MPSASQSRVTKSAAARAPSVPASIATPIPAAVSKPMSLSESPRRAVRCAQRSGRSAPASPRRPAASRPQRKTDRGRRRATASWRSAAAAPSAAPPAAGTGKVPIHRLPAQCAQVAELRRLRSDVLQRLCRRQGVRRLIAHCFSLTIQQERPRASTQSSSLAKSSGSTGQR